VRACDGAELLRLLDANEAHECGHVVAIGAAGIVVFDVGEPFDLRGDVGQPLELGLSQKTMFIANISRQHRIFGTWFLGLASSGPIENTPLLSSIKNVIALWRFPKRDRAIERINPGIRFVGADVPRGAARSSEPSVELPYGPVVATITQPESPSRKLSWTLIYFPWLPLSLHSDPLGEGEEILLEIKLQVAVVDVWICIEGCLKSSIIVAASAHYDQASSNFSKYGSMGRGVTVCPDPINIYFVAR